MYIQRLICLLCIFASYSTSIYADADDVCPTESPAEYVIENSIDTDTDEEPGYLLDAIRAIVITADGTELVTQSDLERPNFFGQIPMLQTEIDERLMYRDAVKMGVTITDEQIDRQIATIMRQHNLTLEALKALCVEYGMTYQELREKLARIYSVNAIRDHKIEGYLIINRSDIIAYYDAHPEMTEVVYYLQRALVPYEGDRETQRAELTTFISSKETDGGIAWGPIFPVDFSALAEEKAFIHSMHVGDIVLAQELYNGFELYRLVDKKEAAPRTLDERYLEIDEILRRPLRTKLLAEYQEKLFNAATIVYV
jgi:SurA-like protein